MSSKSPLGRPGALRGAVSAAQGDLKRREHKKAHSLFMHTFTADDNVPSETKWNLRLVFYQFAEVSGIARGWRVHVQQHRFEITGADRVPRAFDLNEDGFWDRLSEVADACTAKNGIR